MENFWEHKTWCVELLKTLFTNNSIQPITVVESMLIYVQQLDNAQNFNSLSK